MSPFLLPGIAIPFTLSSSKDDPSISPLESMLKSKKMNLFFLLLFVARSFLCSGKIEKRPTSFETCSTEYYCPASNTCCPTGCIPSDMGASNATCCPDNRTGCAVDYACVGDSFCQAQHSTDPLVQRMPRYRLCRIRDTSLLQLRGLLVRENHLLAYFSSHGARENQQAIVVVHGAARNADDYFCTMLDLIDDSSMWIVAPWFLGEDQTVDASFLSWNDLDARGSDNPWRYGAEARNSSISSFEAMDALVDYLLQTTKHVTVVGHSAGGQFVQRWGLLSSLDAFRNRIRVVVTNPSSYAYLSPERYDEDRAQWMIPNAEKTCPEYNRWQWGLDVVPGNFSNIVPQYVKSAIIGMNGTDHLIHRFADRDIIYLVGGQDRCNVSQYDTDGWCFSHGLETTCMDLWQGTNRLERHVRYVESMRRVGITQHRHSIVPNVGHDHSLMFHSHEGRNAILVVHEIAEMIRYDEVQL